MNKLSKDLTVPWMQNRQEEPTLKLTLHDNTRNILKTVLKAQTDTSCDEPAPNKQRYCGFWSHKKDDQTTVLQK